MLYIEIIYIALNNISGRVQLHKNMPLVAGTMKWASELRERLTSQMNNFLHNEHP